MSLESTCRYFINFPLWVDLHPWKCAPVFHWSLILLVFQFFLGLDALPGSSREQVFTFLTLYEARCRKKWGDFICFLLFFKILTSIIMSLRFQRFLTLQQSKKSRVFYSQDSYSTSLGKLVRSKVRERGVQKWTGSLGGQLRPLSLFK